MRHLLTITLVLLSGVVLVQGSQNELSAQQILDSSIKFCGGEEKLAKIKTVALSYLVVQPDKSTVVLAEKIKIGQKYTQSALSRTHTPQTTFFDGKILSRVCS